MGNVSPGRLTAALGLAGLALFLAVRRAARPPLPPHESESFSLRSALPPPAPSAAGLAVRPMGPSSLVEQTEAIGIKRIVPRGEKEPSQGFLGEATGQPGSREQAEAYFRRFAAMSQRFETSGVPLQGESVAVLQAPPKGGEALEAPAREQPPGEPENRKIVTEPDGSWSGSFTPEEAGQRMIRDEEGWRRLWPNCSRDPLPAVDFSRNQVAAVFLGLRPSGGYKVRIVEARLNSDYLLLLWKETAPVPGKTPPEDRTAPFTLRLVPKTELPVRFKKI